MIEPVELKWLPFLTDVLALVVKENSDRSNSGFTSAPIRCRYSS